MKHFLIIACVAFCAKAFSQSRDMTKAEVDFTNRVSKALLNSLPKEFKDWQVDFPEYKDAVVGETRTSDCTYGNGCYYNLGFHIVYDGTVVHDDAFQAFQDSAKKVTYDWHFAALFGRFQNSRQLVVDISVNETSMIGDFLYCGAKGYKSLPPPAPFDHYLFASIMKCFPKDAQKGLPEVNLFVIGKPPVITDHITNDVSHASILFALTPNLPSPFKIQNVVIRMYGSNALAKEFISKMDLTGLKKLMQ